MSAVDKAIRRNSPLKKSCDPKGWTLLNFLMDSRTGLGRFRQFRISNYELMMKLIDYCRDHTVEQILALPDLNEESSSTTNTRCCFGSSSCAAPACTGISSCTIFAMRKQSTRAIAS